MQWSVRLTYFEVNFISKSDSTTRPSEALFLRPVLITDIVSYFTWPPPPSSLQGAVSSKTASAITCFHESSLSLVAWSAPTAWCSTGMYQGLPCILFSVSMSFWPILHTILPITIGVDLAGILRGTHGERRRLVGAERGGVWWGVSPLQPTKGSGGASWAPPSGSGAEPRPKTDFGVFWRPHDAPFCIYMTKIWGGQFVLVSPYSKLWGTCPPCPPPVIYAHAPYMSKKFQLSLAECFQQ